MALQFLPDLPPATPELLVEVEAVPSLAGYKAAASGVAAGYGALAASPLGAALLLQLDGSTRLFAGTATRLYEASGSSWTDRSAGGVAYTTTATKWRFSAFGLTSLAVNKTAQVQYSNSGAFAAVAASPKANLIEVCNGFVLLADCDDTGCGIGTAYGDQGHRWWCSQSFNATGSYAPSVTTQATTGLLVDVPGKIVALKRLGSNVVAYKNSGLFLGTLVGPPVVWQWTPVPGNIGTWSNESVVSIGSAHLFIGAEDIYLFDGSRPVPIGEGIREWFFARLNKQYAYLIDGTHDAINGAVYWAYPSGQNSTPDSILVYNYRAKRWGHITRSTTCVTQTVIQGVTYDGFGSLYSTYADTPAIAYDSPFWQTSAAVMSYFDTSFVLKTFSGVGGDSSLRTGLVGDDEQVSLCYRLRPRFRAVPATAQLSAGAIFRHGDTVSMGSPVALNGDRFDVLQSGRWHQFLMDTTGDFEVLGFIPQFRKQGTE